ncbi:DNA-binding helix-turn-helix protein [Leptospira interrogans str. FPW1039]|uniref:DNA-binding helix-turn-helix protein n=4 Tax=Leptospira TaxID=171 RepID=M6ZI06_LEPIR|nr:MULTISPECIES: helix-turn-helix transcriptional regulator [Leptospira]EMF44270.1 DNA-binding helix-turn-helix protein [Leptospira interrogans serovar Lora str. TE 1992]EMP05721.1 DNA-binding helix-turn-helix protein [Leptospira interrogans serovar Pyrogenes str. 200701872]EKO53567.1 DNA-binding helix-turn-helix protein [Leptospira kirschneri str. 200802841]EMJ34402.1 DNA-binding helix-turn-helix protein [Leptospira interrogans str. FPW1039]EMO78612.1 DNA-binding helix-turn-helix protein [Lep
MTDEAKRLQKFMKQLGLTQVQIANETGYSQASISRYINGRDMDMQFLLKLKERYNANPIWFPTGEGSMFLSSSEELDKQTDEIRFLIRGLREREGMLQFVQRIVKTTDSEWKKVQEMVRLLLGQDD